MNASSILLLALVLACPLMMVFMHRAGGGRHGSHGDRAPEAPLEELRRRRSELDAEIAERERSLRARSPSAGASRDTASLT